MIAPWLWRWPPGLAFAAWRELTSDVPVHRVEDVEDVHAPESVRGPDMQPAEDGFGPLFHRRYSARIHVHRWDAETVMGRFIAAPDAMIPGEVARFVPESGHPDLRVGDDLVVRMPGPWNGPVRVVQVLPTSFRLATRRGHLEAGQIEFRAADEGVQLLFEIESWARSATWAADLLYDRLGLSRFLQGYMWVQCCARVCAAAGGTMVQGVEIYTGRDAAAARR